MAPRMMRSHRTVLGTRCLLNAIGDELCSAPCALVEFAASLVETVLPRGDMVATRRPGAFCKSSSECGFEGLDRCDKSLLPREFPRSREAYETGCLNGLTYITCLSDVLDTCESDDEESQFIRGVIVYIQRRVCNPESHIYEVLTNNLKCIESSLITARGACSAESKESQRKALDELEDYMREKLDINEQFSLEEGRNCMGIIFGVACIAVTSGQECGTPVGDALLDLDQNTNYHLQKCPTHLLDEMPYVVNTLRSIVEAGEEVKNAIKKRK